MATSPRPGRCLPVAVLAAALVAGCAGSRPAAAPAAPSVPAGGTAAIQLLAFNDFHGNLEPPGGSNGRIGNTEAGGIAFFATHMARLRATNASTLIVSAGDNIGASPLLSGMFHDEPTIEALGEAGLDVSTVGNHEFDEGWTELVRMQTGGCHPVDGCQDQTPFSGARFAFLSANVLLDRGQGPRTLFPPFTVRDVGGVKVGLIGLVLKGAASLASPAGLKGVTFTGEVEAGNAAAAELTRQGVKTIVVLIHEGGVPSSQDPDGCDVTGPIVDIANGLSSDIDVVVSGHTHRAYVCTMGTKLVTSAASFGRLITDIDLTIDRATGDVVSKTARNVVVTRDVPPHAGVTALVDRYRPFYTPLATRVVGTIAAEIRRAANDAGESALGDVIADMYLETGQAADPTAVAAFTNSGGIRSDLVGQPPAAPGSPRTVLYSQAFDVLPFGNSVVVRTMTGDAVLRWLDEQVNRGVILQVSRGVSYTYDRARPEGQRLDRASVRIGGRPVVSGERYRIVSSDFLWSGGDGFKTTAEATDPVAAAIDIDAFVAYLTRHSPVAPGSRNRINRQ